MYACGRLNRAMVRDPSRYKDPESFNPDRFIPSDGTEPEDDPREIVFGFGRRLVSQSISIHCGTLTQRIICI